MPVEYRIHSTWKRAVLIVAAALIVAVAVTQRRKDTSQIQQFSPEQTSLLEREPESALLIPTISLEIPDASLEAGWSEALAKAINGSTEHVIPSGRVDVLSADFAIEVDRIEKWHEGIGQAIHYGRATERVPCLALIVPSDSWPLNADVSAKLRLIESTALASGVKIVLLKRKFSEAKETSKDTQSLQVR